MLMGLSTFRFFCSHGGSLGWQTGSWVTIMTRNHPYQVWFKLAKWLQRRLKCELLRDDGHQVVTIDHMTLGMVELKKTSNKRYVKNTKVLFFRHFDLVY